jgi:hypothetical protein
MWGFNVIPYDLNGHQEGPQTLTVTPESPPDKTACLKGIEKF